jgi:hypothetical protein
LRAISVRQPWAWAIARGHKPVLNRATDTGHRGPLAVCASFRIDLESAENHMVRRAVSTGWDPADPVTAVGGIIAVVSLTGVCPPGASPGGCGCGEWASPGAYHWQLTDPRPLRWLVLALGQPGLWELAPEVADGVTRLQADEPVRAPR